MDYRQDKKKSNNQAQKPGITYNYSSSYQQQNNYINL
jgi:hypothetical protein